MNDYIRVLPRDAFNEANLLKCIGRLTLLELEGKINEPDLEFEYDNKPFIINQCFSDGSIFVLNFKLIYKGEKFVLHRPLNSRDNYPLYLDYKNKEHKILTEDGKYDSPFKTKNK